MSSIKFGLLALVTLLLSSTMNAQTMEEGKKFMYYERYQSAKNVFQKILFLKHLKLLFKLEWLQLTKNSFFISIKEFK